MTKDTYTFGITWFASNRHLITLEADQTLHDLHQGIFREFKMDDETHMYRFFVPFTHLVPSKVSRGGWHFSKISKVSKAYFDPREYGSPINFLFPVGDDDASKTTIGSLNLKLGQYFYYLFDFGDEQWFTISVQRIVAGEGSGTH